MISGRTCTRSAGFDTCARSGRTVSACVWDCLPLRPPFSLFIGASQHAVAVGHPSLLPPDLAGAQWPILSWAKSFPAGWGDLSLAQSPEPWVGCDVWGTFKRKMVQAKYRLHQCQTKWERLLLARPANSPRICLRRQSPGPPCLPLTQSFRQRLVWPGLLWLPR